MGEGWSAGEREGVREPKPNETRPTPAAARLTASSSSPLAEPAIISTWRRMQRSTVCGARGGCALSDIRCQQITGAPAAGRRHWSAAGRLASNVLRLHGPGRGRLHLPQHFPSATRTPRVNSGYLAHACAHRNTTQLEMLVRPGKERVRPGKEEVLVLDNEKIRTRHVRDERIACGRRYEKIRTRQATVYVSSVPGNAGLL